MSQHPKQAKKGPIIPKVKSTKSTQQREELAKEKLAKAAAPSTPAPKQKSTKKNEAAKPPRPLPQPGRPSSTSGIIGQASTTTTFAVSASKRTDSSNEEQLDRKKHGNIKGKPRKRNKSVSDSKSEERGMKEELMQKEEESGSLTAHGSGTRNPTQTTKQAASRSTQPTRVLILGKTGNGKSSLGNLILGRDVFTVGKSRMSSCTKDVATEEGIVDVGPTQVRVEVTDTPDVTTDESKRAQLTWLARNVTFDLVLFTVRVDVRYSPEEQQFYKHMKDVFTQALTRNLVVTFTFGDKLDGDVTQFTKIPSLQEVLRDAGGRHVVVNNKAKAKQKKEHVVKLLQYLDGDSYPKRGSAASSGRSSVAKSMDTADVANHDIDNERGLRYANERDGLNSTTKTITQQRANERTGGQQDDMLEGPPCVLVIGKTGNGKSSVCNMLLGEKRFKEGRGMSSTTTSTESEQSSQAARFPFTVVDTPDISSSDFGGDPQEEMDRWRRLNPDAILLAVRCDLRYTPEEYMIYRQIREGLGKAYVTSRLIVAFTFGDLQDHPLEDDLQDAGEHLQAVTCHQAGNRHVLFNKKATAQEQEKCLRKLTSILTEIRTMSQTATGSRHIGHSQ